MSTGEAVINSYDSGQKPYIHDPRRGKWEGRWDFYFACFANAFGMRTFYMFAAFMQMSAEVYIIVPLLIATFLYVIPVFFVQSFLGQFSSTGFISVFRISPLFKGVGYLILIMNFLSSVYSSSVASFPLLYFLKSFQFNTTWMYCDNEWNSVNCTNTMNRSRFYPYTDFNETDSMDPPYEYYYAEVLKQSYEEDVFSFSWTVILGELFIWIATGYIIYHGVTMVGKYLRYTAIICTLISVILFIRVCCLPEAGEDTAKFFSFHPMKGLSQPLAWIVGPFIASTVLGRGWGITLTLASYQPFKANAERSSYIIPVLLAFLSVTFGFMVRLIDGFVSRRSGASMMYYNHDSHEYLFVTFSYFFGKIEWSQFWSILFYFKYFIAELGLIVIQAFATITALSDEYVQLREYKLFVSLGVCAVSFLVSTLFATENFVEILRPLISSGYANQMFICFLEILIVVWIYGRMRFIRDVRFMLVKNIAAWKFYIVRFATPLFVLLTGLIYLETSVFLTIRQSIPLQIFILFTKVVPWIIIPGYIIAKLFSSIGTIRERFNRCTQPNDWYPADPLDKHKYELALGTSDLSQQLLEMNDNNTT